MNMIKNVGSTDKIARLAVGALLILLALTGIIGWWGWIGVVPIATALMNWCPAYTLLGINTCPTSGSPGA
jgi:membrane-associated protease RseP (regulator of RpoE activity)